MRKNSRLDSWLEWFRENCFKYFLGLNVVVCVVVAWITDYPPQEVMLSNLQKGVGIASGTTAQVFKPEEETCNGIVVQQNTAISVAVKSVTHNKKLLGTDTTLLQTEVGDFLLKGIVNPLGNRITLVPRTRHNTCQWSASLSASLQ